MSAQILVECGLVQNDKDNNLVKYIDPHTMPFKVLYRFE